eukprot:3215356-Amphidinium_carterae.1
MEDSQIGMYVDLSDGELLPTLGNMSYPFHLTNTISSSHISSTWIKHTNDKSTPKHTASKKRMSKQREPQDV